MLELVEKKHRDQIEISLDKTAGPEFGTAELPFVMPDLDLGDPETFPVDQGGKIAVKFAVDFK